jgi:hypothetical protein
MSWRALDNAMREALVGLSEPDQRKIKLAIGHVMGEIVEKLINPTVRAFPELQPDQITCSAVAKARAGKSMCGLTFVPVDAYRCHWRRTLG